MDYSHVSTETWVTDDERVHGTFNTAVLFTQELQSTINRHRTLENEDAPSALEDQFEYLDQE
ncbi:MAG: hypothetical protein LQ352_006477, partial [Teloschistes flavicans]